MNLQCVDAKLALFVGMVAIKRDIFGGVYKIICSFAVGNLIIAFLDMTTDDTPTQQTAHRPAKPVRFKTPKHYRLAFYNENTLNCDWSLKMSGRRLLLMIIVVAFCVVCIGAMLMAFTPLKNFLPGYLRPAERQEYLEASSRLDSLLNVARLNDAYINNITNILDGKLSSDSLLSGLAHEAVPADERDSLLRPTSLEAAFVSEYLGREQSAQTDSVDVASGAKFAVPVKNAVVKAGRAATRPEFTLEAGKVTVYAVAAGRVIDIYTNDNKTYSLVMQHADGYISIYRGLTQLYRDRGSYAGMGARLGAIGRGGSTEDKSFGFELIHDGVALNPMKYIDF
jgi:lipoprotein NlpD